MVAVSLLVGLLAASCNRKSSEHGAKVVGVNGEGPQRGGVLTMAVAAIASTFDPAVAGSTITNVWTMPHIFSRLVRTGKDGRSIEPDLAESWEITPDGRVYTFHLRPNLVFSDGSPLRSSDVRFSFKRALAERKNPQQSIFPPLEILAPDEKTVVIKLETAHAPLLALLTVCAMSVLPEAYVKRVGETRIGEEPIGSGPFVVVKWRPGERLILRKNPRYWNASHPYLDEIRILSIPDEMTRMLKIQAGEVDMAVGVPFNQVALLRRTPRTSVQVSPSFEMTLLGLNRRVAALNDIKVRQALFLAIDREAIIRTILFGHGAVPASFLPRLLYTSEQPLVHDLKRAKQLLAESGHPNGFSATLLVLAQPIHQQVAILLQSQLESLGVHVKIQQVEGSHFWERLAKGDTELTVLGGRADTFDPAELTQYAVTSGGFIATTNGYKNPEVDALAVRAQTENDPLQRATLYRKLEQIVFSDVPYVPLFLGTGRDAIRTNVHGLGALPTSDTYRLWEVWKSP